jgi:hypothetical protein
MPQCVSKRAAQHRAGVEIQMQRGFDLEVELKTLK